MRAEGLAPDARSAIAVALAGRPALAVPTARAKASAASTPGAPATQALARHAVRALHAELTLEPKPGLVSLRDSGSHDDMDAGCFVRSLFALRHYFAAIARAGAENASFEGALRPLGQQAEACMLAATGGINTHRGAIFALGLLCAAGGRLQASGRPLRAQPVDRSLDAQPLNQPFGAKALRAQMQASWGEALRAHAERARSAPARSHGQRVARAHGLRSAADEAADGFPTLFDVTLPALQAARRAGLPDRAARAQALFATMASLADTNLVHRGGLAGLRFAQSAAGDFLAAGGAHRPDWVRHARSLHDAFVARRLSPGGAADLLGCACWVETVAADPRVTGPRRHGA